LELFSAFNEDNLIVRADALGAHTNFGVIILEKCG